MFAKEMCEGKKDNFPDQLVFPQPLSAALLELQPPQLRGGFVLGL